MDNPQDSPLQEKLVPRSYWAVSLSGTKSLGASIGAEWKLLLSLGGGSRDFVVFKDLLGIIDAFVLAFGQNLSDDLLCWAGGISDGKWWQQ